MVQNVQRTLIAGNRKSQLACSAVLSHMQTVVFAGFPTDRCHLDVFKWVVIHCGDVHLALFLVSKAELGSLPREKKMGSHDKRK